MLSTPPSRMPVNQRFRLWISLWKKLWIMMNKIQTCGKTPRSLIFQRIEAMRKAAEATKKVVDFSSARCYFIAPAGLKDVLTGGMTVSDEVVGKQRNQGKYKAVSCCVCGAKLGMLEAPEDKGIHYCGKCRKNYLISLKDGKLTYEVFTQAR